MNFAWLRKTKRNSIVAVLDIGSGAVGLVVLKNTHQGMEVLYQATESFNLGLDRSFKRFAFELERVLKSSLNHLFRHHLPRINEFHVFLSSPFIVSQTRVISYDELKAKPTTDKLFHNLMKQGAAEFLKQNSPLASDLCLIENKLLRIKLDGYQIDNPLNQKAKNIELTQFLSASPSLILDRLFTLIAGVTHNDQIHFHSFILAAWSTWRDLLPGADHFTLIDISGELTDIAISREGVLAENLSFPLGIKHLVNRLSAEHGHLPFGTETLLKMFAAGTLRHAEEEKLIKILEPVKELWLADLTKALTAAAKSGPIPHKVILTGDTPLAPLFKEWINTHHFGRINFAGGALQAKYFDRHELFNQLSWPSAINDIYLLLEAVYCQKILTKN